MKRKLAAVLLLASALMSSGCSIICEFIVVNESDAPLEVRYTHKPSAVPPNGRIDVPGVLGAGKVNSSGKEWKTLPPERYTIDPKTGHVWAKVEPGEALRVDEIINYSGHDSRYSDEIFRIDSLSLEGAKGSIRYQGRQAMTQFVESKRGTYLIRYR